MKRVSKPPFCFLNASLGGGQTTPLFYPFESVWTNKPKVSQVPYGSHNVLLQFKLLTAIWRKNL